MLTEHSHTIHFVTIIYMRKKKGSETMTQMNQNNEPIDVTYTQKQGKKKKQKNFSFLTVFLSMVLSLACGLGGGWFAYSHLGGSSSSSNSSTGITYSDASSPSSTTTVSSNESGTGLTTSEVAAKASASVVEIVTESTSTQYGMFGGTYTSQAAGSGVIISKDGYIITNNHVVEGADSIKVTTYDNKEYNATLVGTDEASDIAVIKVDATDLTPATIGDSSKLQAGDTAVVIGNPLGTLGGTVTDGIISSPSREMVINNQSMELIQTNAEINSGNSGGGLFDGNGNLVGIVNAKDSGTTSSGTVIEGIGFAIPINTAMSVAEELMQYGEVVDRATLGVYLQEVSSNYYNYTPGLYITGTADGSGAEQAGLKAYDRIVKADGTEISSQADLTKVLRDKKVGDTITLTIERQGRQMNVQVTLGSSGSINNSGE